MEYYAHTPGASGRWQPLAEHLVGVAEMARSFAQTFGMGDLAYLLGLLHDLGKYNPEFQQYLQAAHAGRDHPPVPHAVWGAALVYGLTRSYGVDAWKELALPILGHHAGLEDAGVAASKLEAFWRERGREVVEAQKRLAEAGLRLPIPRLPTFINPTQREFAIRMILSALVDADHLDTERHFEPEQAALRGRGPSLQALWDRLEAAQREILDDSTLVNRVRSEVYEACVRAASGPPGVYRLTVPTGGGKTRSGLAFALKHALAHGLRRVVVAIPYTSIIDQTAQVYREILGDDAVLEHHSALEVAEGDEEGQDEWTLRQRLATENWDAPVVVTTTVQFLESLFSNRPSKVRKIHRLSRAVILLDEVQTLPPELLQPTLDVLTLLATPVEQGGYGSTIVLSTATQPTFDTGRWRGGLHDVAATEIVPDYPKHFALLRRVEYTVRPDPVTWPALAREIEQLPQVLVVLNSRRDALALLAALDGVRDVFHLSTLLCGAHRKKVLQEVRRRLQVGEPVRLVSTQVVEAGVDLDFPVVYRAIGPLDRIVQAAGRCNREGRRRTGQVVVFEPADGKAPTGPYRVGLEKARFLLREYPSRRLHDPELYHEYFRRLFADVDLDKKRIQSYRQQLSYPEVASRYRLIDARTVPVVVPYEEATARLEEFKARPGYGTWRRLQPYVVNLFSHEVTAKGAWLEKVSEGLYLWTGAYDERYGLVEAYSDPADLIV